MIPAMTLWNRQDLEDSKRISGCQGLKDREVWYSAKDFSGSETTLHHTTLVNTYYYMYGQNQECTIPKVIQFSRSVVSNSLRPHEPQHARPPCPSPTARVHPNSCPLSQ